MPEQLTVVILAGGHSQRMGQDKAWLLFDGQPLVLHVARRLLPLAGEVIISTNAPERYEGLGGQLRMSLRAVPDLHPGAGPLAGLEASLQAAIYPLALMVAVDMPFLNLSLLRHMHELASGYDVVMPFVPKAGTEEQEPEPLHAFYRRTCLPAISAHLAQGRRRVVSFLSDVKVRDVPPEEIARFDPQFRSFFNANTPDDWTRATSQR